LVALFRLDLGTNQIAAPKRLLRPLKGDLRTKSATATGPAGQCK
jgi:hypothetical protein